MEDRALQAFEQLGLVWEAFQYAVDLQQNCLNS